MKKKIIPLLILLTSLSSLVGCSKNEKSQLTYGKIYQNETSSDKKDVFTLINYDDTQKTETSPSVIGLYSRIVTKKETLLLATYQEGGSCSCFRSLLSSVSVMNSKYQNHYLVYLIAEQQFSGKSNTFGLFVPSSDTVTFSIFANGNLQKQWIDEGASPAKLFSDADALKASIDEYVIAPRLILAENDQTLDKIIATTNNLVIYFGRSGCPDCSYIDSVLIFPYLKTNSTCVYTIDLEQYRYEKGMEHYQEIKNKYHLTVTSDPILGYSEGVIPSFMRIENQKYTDSMVIYNDEVTQISDNDFVVSESFYTEERAKNLQYLDSLNEKVIKGKHLTKDDVKIYPEYENYVEWIHESSTKTYEPFFKAFMNKYAK